MNRRGAPRKIVFDRDKGICARCGTDTEAARIICAGFGGVDDPEARERFRSLGYPSPYETWWDCHHIVEVANGGTDNLENLQTLCFICHKAKTADFATSRAAERRTNSACGYGDDQAKPTP